jgi:hypothetical protein
MKITLDQHGGHLPMRRNSKFEIDTQNLPEITAKEVERLIEAARNEAPPGPTISVPDGMTYVITVDGGAELRQSDAALSGEFSALMDLLNTLKPRS